MKQLLVFISMFCFSSATDAQELKKKWGFGTQLTDRVVGISLKYALSNASDIQFVAAPYNTKTADGLGKHRYYAFRYIHKIPADEDYALRIEPFVMVSAGWMHYQPEDADNTLLRMSSSFTSTATAKTLPVFCTGAGLEWLLGSHLSLSAELDYGRMQVKKGETDYAFLGAAGLHVFLK